MANHFVKASFLLIVTDAEAEVLRRVHEAIEITGDPGLERAEREARYRSLGEGFAACFPPTEAEVFSGFLAIFSDPDYPRLGFSLQVDPSDGSGECQVWLRGDQVDIEAAAALIHAVARSALPFGFEYALDCDRLRPGEFGGGYVLVREDEVEFGGSARLLERALARTAGDAPHGLVLTTRDVDEGLLFWNTDTGFGSLEKATVFSEAAADQHDLPIAHDQPEWLAMPEPLS
ncbi:hypothetical protein [Rhizorhapis sp. SPR117]|uniref:hypothetical protein n=1 Tax=Rhizorhapis sp. SPR117 TaxID=2912611 RepID=UPI001F35C359